jgi:outer membrane lipoprotein-sorting protein
VNHSDARRSISERMDGERLSPRIEGALGRHLDGCADCRSFEAGAWRLRERARFGVADPVPDLVGPIMASVRREATLGRRVRRARRPRAARPGWARGFAPLAAAVAVGVAAGSLTVGGPWRSDDRTALASAADVSAGVAAAASKIDAYQATFAIEETDPGRTPTSRQLSMDVAFVAPERFRLDVHDRTPGAGTRFGADDLQLIVNGGSAYQMAPSACPVAVCPEREREVRNRVPFSSATPAPTDLILPVSTLVDSREMTVVGRGTVLGRDAVEVRLPFARARPLFPFLTLGGTWRPFFDGDHVELWLDATDWFPLRYAVFPASGARRDEWALRFGLPDEPPGRPILVVRALSIRETPAPPAAFRVPKTRSAADEGGRTVSIEEVRRNPSLGAAAPEAVDGLRLYRAVAPEGRQPRTVLSYASGLSWLKLDETRASNGEAFFGPVGPHAQAISIDGVGTAYYEPASPRHGRRLAVHTAGGDVYLETNLSRQRLLDAAAALRLRAEPVPAPWLTTSSPIGSTRRSSVEDAVAEVPFRALLPADAPTGFAPTSAEVVTVGEGRSLNLYFRGEDASSPGGSLRLHEEAARELPPASAPHQFVVRVRGTDGRWTPGRHQLEWIEDGVYVSLDGPGLEIQQLLDVAASLAPVGTVGDAPTPTPAASTP